MSSDVLCKYSIQTVAAAHRQVGRQAGSIALQRSSDSSLKMHVYMSVLVQVESMYRYVNVSTSYAKASSTTDHVDSVDLCS